MVLIYKVVYESIRQALQSLMANKLRSFLSLVGITIGIFSIISVKSAVDSLENSVKDGFSELGTNAIYVEKYPWNEDWETSYWKYAKRPEPDLEDFEAIREKSKLAEATAYNVFTGGRSITYKSNSVSGAFIMGGAYDFQKIQQLKFTEGRYFNLLEYNVGANKAILGHTVATELFKELNPIGKEIKLLGQKYQVIGVLKEEGESPFNFLNFDEVVWIGLPNARRFINIKDENTVGRMPVIKGREDVDNEELKSEITSIIRKARRLRPLEKDNFSLMEISALNQILDSFFGVLNMAGFAIGIFALVVGMFSVANIMFVSVKERTNIIGIKKAIGAKRFVILLEFLIEAIVLCIIGGLVGLVFVYIVLKVISNLIPFSMALTYANAIHGIGWSVVVGLISGVVPAFQASKLDPVEAIRA